MKHQCTAVAHSERKTPVSPPELECRDNNEKFNALLNSCTNPRRVYNVLLALAEAGYPLESLKQELEDAARQDRKE